MILVSPESGTKEREHLLTSSRVVNTAISRLNSSAASSLHFDLPSPSVHVDSPSFTKFRTSMATDCYAFAMKIFEMGTLQRPFAELHDLAAYLAAERGIRPRLPHTHSQSCYRPLSPKDQKRDQDDGGLVTCHQPRPIAYGGFLRGCGVPILVNGLGWTL